MLVGSRNKTLGSAGLLLPYKNNLYTVWKKVLTKCDLPQPPPHEGNRWNGVDYFKVVPHLTFTSNLAQLCIKSDFVFV